MTLEPAAIEDTELDADEETSEEAPYGYKADGTPRKRPGRKPGSTNSGSTSSRGLENLREPLTQRLVEYMGAPLMMVSPIGAAVWEERADRTADAILVLARRSPRWRKWLERFVAGSAGGDIGITMVGVVTGIMVDNGRVSPEGKIARYYGIDDIYTELYGAYDAAQNGNGYARGLFADVITSDEESEEE